MLSDCNVPNKDELQAMLMQSLLLYTLSWSKPIADCTAIFVDVVFDLSGSAPGDGAQPQDLCPEAHQADGKGR